MRGVAASDYINANFISVSTNVSDVYCKGNTLFSCMVVNDFIKDFVH